MKNVFLLYRIDDDDEYILVGAYESRKSAKCAMQDLLDEYHIKKGKLAIFKEGVDQIAWKEGYVTEYEDPASEIDH